MTIHANDIRTVAEALAPSLVRIGRDHRGTGMIVDDHTVVTSAHHLRDRTTTVTFADGTTVPGEVRGTDRDGDLVALEVDTGDRPAVDLGEAPLPELGDEVLTVGIDPGLGPRATVGRVSAVARTFRGPRGRKITGALEHTAPVRRGSSGGPLLDADGRLVAVNTHRLPEGLYLARPLDDAFRARLATVTSGNDVVRPRLGVALAPPEVAARLRRAVGLPERTGLLVREVEADSPAADAGLGEGDLLVRAGARDLLRSDDLFAALDDAEGTIELVVVRGAEEATVAVTFG